MSKSEKKGWGDLIGGYLENPERDLELVFQLIDMRHAPTKDDIQMINFLIDYEIPFVIVFTKADKLKRTAREERLRAFEQEIPCFEDITCIPFSTVTGEGVDEIRRIIEEISENAEIYEPDYEDQEIADDSAGNSNSGFLTPRSWDK